MWEAHESEMAAALRLHDEALRSAIADQGGYVFSTAGDAFAGAMAVYWAESNSLFDAIRFGNAAGALSASRHGAQPSMATREEIYQLWSSL